MASCVPKRAIERLAECPICTEFLGPPKQLPCNHTICLGCVNNILHSTREKGLNQDLNTVLCPLCRSEVQIPDGDATRLPTNLLMVQLQETVASTEVKRVDALQGKLCDRCVQCEQAHPHEADLYCKDCSTLKYLCKECAARHKERPLFNSHTIVPKQYVLCRQHGTNFQFLCVNCSKFLCEACVDTGECDTHEILAVKDIEPAKMKDIGVLIDDIELMMIKDKSEIQPFIDKLKTQVKATQDTKLSIKVQCAAFVERLKRDEQRLLQEVQNREDTLLATLKLVENNHGPNILSDLRDAANEAKEMGVEQTIMSLPAIRARLPPAPALPPSEAIDMDMKFVPTDQPPRLGEIVTNHPIRLLWKKTELLEGVDIAFLPSGHFVVSDRGDKKVLLYDTFGNTLANSGHRGVNLKGPYGIAAFPLESAIIVADYDGGMLVLLDNKSLRHIRSIKLQGVNHPRGVDTLHAGQLVVSHSDKISVHDMNGKKLKEWKHFANKTPFKCPYYVTVDSLNHIWVSDWEINKVVLFRSSGEYLQDVSTPKGRNLGICIDKDFKIHVAIHNGGVNSGYAKDQGDFKPIISLDSKLRDAFGELSSVAVQGSYMAVVARTGVIMYTADQQIV